MYLQRWLLITIVAIGVCACGTEAKLQVDDGIGPNPKLPPPDKEVIPTLKIAPAIGWTDGAKPTAAQGTKVVPFADGLDHPRWVYVLRSAAISFLTTSHRCAAAVSTAGRTATTAITSTNA